MDILSANWLARLYPVRTYFVKEVMKIDLDYIDSFALSDAMPNYPAVASKEDDYLLGGKS